MPLNSVMLEKFISVLKENNLNTPAEWNSWKYSEKYKWVNEYLKIQNYFGKKDWRLVYSWLTEVHIKEEIEKGNIKENSENFTDNPVDKTVDNTVDNTADNPEQIKPNSTIDFNIVCNEKDKENNIIIADITENNEQTKDVVKEKIKKIIKDISIPSACILAFKLIGKFL